MNLTLRTGLITERALKWYNNLNYYKAYPISLIPDYMFYEVWNIIEIERNVIVNYDLGIFEKLVKKGKICK